MAEDLQTTLDWPLSPQKQLSRLICSVRVGHLDARSTQSLHQSWTLWLPNCLYLILLFLFIPFSFSLTASMTRKEEIHIQTSSLQRMPSLSLISLREDMLLVQIVKNSKKRGTLFQLKHTQQWSIKYICLGGSSAVVSNCTKWRLTGAGEQPDRSL